MPIDFKRAHCKLRYGVCGIRVWVAQVLPTYYSIKEYFKNHLYIIKKKDLRKDNLIRKKLVWESNKNKRRNSGEIFLIRLMAIQKKEQKKTRRDIKIKFLKIFVRQILELRKYKWQIIDKKYQDQILYTKILRKIKSKTIKKKRVENFLALHDLKLKIITNTLRKNSTYNFI